MVVRVEIPASEAPAEAPAPAAVTTPPAAAEAPSNPPAAVADPAPAAASTTPPAAPAGTEPSAVTPPAPLPPSLDLSKYMASYAANGKLTETDYEELKASGLSKDFVDSHIAGRLAVSAQEEAAIYDTVGGKAEYAKLTAWAKANVDPAEIAAYNDALDNMPISTIKLVVAGLKARFEAANGSEPTLVGGVPSGGNPAYQSIAQVTEAMKDPRYRKDPAYRAEVEQRLAGFNGF